MPCLNHLSGMIAVGFPVAPAPKLGVVLSGAAFSGIAGVAAGLVAIGAHILERKAANCTNLTTRHTLEVLAKSVQAAVTAFFLGTAAVVLTGCNPLAVIGAGAVFVCIPLTLHLLKKNLKVADICDKVFTNSCKVINALGSVSFLFHAAVSIIVPYANYAVYGTNLR